MLMKKTMCVMLGLMLVMAAPCFAQAPKKVVKVVLDKSAAQTCCKKSVQQAIKIPIEDVYYILPIGTKFTSTKSNCCYGGRKLGLCHQTSVD